MEMITVSAKTMDEAITKALLELQTTSEHLYYEVVQKESSGFLGIFGGKPCVIRARVMGEEEEREKKRQKAEKEKAAKAAAEKAEKEKAEAEKAARAAKAAAEKPAKEEVSKPAKAVKPVSEKAAFEKKEKIISEKPERPVSEKKEKPEEVSLETTSEKPEKPARRENSRRDGRRRQDRRDPARFENREKKPAEVKEEKPEKVRQEVKMDPELVQRKAKEFLGQVFNAMGMKVSMETVIDEKEGEMQVMLEGDDMGILIGKRGQTLDSLQYLVSLVVNKETEGYLRVKLDTENYRERRKDTLETLARNISYKVKRTKRPVSLEPMNPYERRIIHSALQNDRYVVTRSEGEDPYRHVVISLKKDSYSGGGKRDRYSRKDREYRNRKNEKASEETVKQTGFVDEMVETPAVIVEETIETVDISVNVVDQSVE